jgi:hypothetical protein
MLPVGFRDGGQIDLVRFQAAPSAGASTRSKGGAAMSFLLVYQYGSRRENEAERFDTKTEAVTMGMHTHYRR